MIDEKHDIVGQATRNIKQILAIISEEKRWYTILEISERSDMITRTVQRYIHELDARIRNFNDDNIQLLVTKNKGVFLELHPGADLSGFSLFLLEDNITIDLLKSLFFENFHSVKKFAYDNFMSETTIRRLLKMFQEIVEPYQIHLTRETFIIEGKESQIRLFIYIIFWKVYRGATWPFETINRKLINNHADKVATILKLNLTAIHKQQIAYILAINIIRVRKKHFIEKEDRWDHYINIEEDYSGYKKFKAIFEDMNMGSDGEISFFYLIMETRPKIYEVKEISDRIMNYHKKQNSSIWLATELFLIRFSENFLEIPEDQRSIFITNSFCAHLFCDLFDNFSLDINGYEYLDNHEKFYPILNTKLDSLIDELYAETKNKIFLEKEFLLTRYALLFSLLKPLTYFEKEIQIVLDTDLPKLAEINLKNQILDTLKYRYTIVFLDKNNAEEADLFLTTTPTPLLINQYLDGKVLYIGSQLSPRDFINIETIVADTIKEKN